MSYKKDAKRIWVKRVQKLFFHLTAAQFMLLLLSKNKSEIRYSIYCILYHTHITKMAKETLVYQNLKFIITFSSGRNIIALGDDRTKGSIANMHIYFHYAHAHFLDIACKSINGDNGCTQ